MSSGKATRRFLASIVDSAIWIGDRYTWCFGTCQYQEKDTLAEMQLAYFELLQDILARAERRGFERGRKEPCDHVKFPNPEEIREKWFNMEDDSNY